MKNRQIDLRSLSSNFAICLLVAVCIFNSCSYGAPIPFIYKPLIVAMICLLLSTKGHMCVDRMALPVFFNLVSIILSMCISGKWDSMINVIFVYSVYTLMVILILSIPFSKKDFVFILNVYSLICTVLGILIIFRFTAGISGAGAGLTDLFGIKKDRNFFSAYMIPGFAYTLYRVIFVRKKTLFFLTCTILEVIGILLTGSRAAFVVIMLVFALAVFFFIRKERIGFKKIAVLILIGIAFIIVYSYISSTPSFNRLIGFNDYSDDVRVKLWSIGFNSFLQHPIFGGGRGTTNSYTTLLDGHVTHNTYLEVLGDQGLVGFLCFVLSFINIFKVREEGKRFIIPFSIACFLPRLFVSDYSGCGFWLMLALNLAIAKNYKDTNDYYLIQANEDV